jgi:ABC-type transport system substrate-binding protein
MSGEKPKREISPSLIIAIIVIIVLLAALVYYATLPPAPTITTTTAPPVTVVTTIPTPTTLMTTIPTTIVTTVPVTLTTPTPTVTPVVPDFVKENTYRIEGLATFEWLDPHVSYYMFDYWILYQTVEPLLWFKGESPTEIIPWLAEKYEKISPYKYKFTLRKGVYFQDGTPLNSTAVWFSLNRILIIDGTSGTGVHGSQAAWIVQQMLDKGLSSYYSGDQPYDEAWVKKVLDQKFVEIIDDYTFYLNIKNPTTMFEYLISMPWAAIVSPTSTIAMDYEYHKWGKWDGNYTKYFVKMAGVGDTALNVPEKGWKIGTGPYMLESVDPTTYRIVLKANPRYWGGPPEFKYYPVKPKIEKIEYIYQPALATRLLDLKVGKVTGVAVAPLDIFSVVDRAKWLEEDKLVSIIPYVTVFGPYSELSTVWFNFCTNVTDPTGRLKDFQPIADWRIRMAIACAVNMSYMNIYANNKLGVEAFNLIPPGTSPEGSYIPDVKPLWSFNLTRAEELLKDAWKNPMKSATHAMYYYNGTRIPPGVVDNSWGPDKPRVIEIYVPAGATHYEMVATTIAENLNRIIWRNREMRGLTFQVVPVPGGQQYTLASMHRIYMYWGGWHADYNHVINWLGPMLLPTGTYFSWNLWNITKLNELYFKAEEADAKGDMKTLLEINKEMNKITNEMILYLWLWHPKVYFVRSTWTKGFYYNPALGMEYIATIYYETP